MSDTSNIDRFAAENVRKNALEALENIQNSTLDMGRLTDPEYLSSLNPAQLGRIKKVITDRNGVIVSVELNDMVGLILAKANIAGVKEKTAADAKAKLAETTAKAKAEAEVKKKAMEKKEEKSKYKSNKLTIAFDPKKAGKEAVTTVSEPEEQPVKKSEKSTLSEVFKNATAKK